MRHHRHKIWIFILLILVLLVSAGCRRTTEQEEIPAVDPNELNGNGSGPGDEQDEAQEQAEMIHFVLYLKHRDQAFIFSDTYSIREDDPALAEKTLAEYVIERLISQPGVGDLINPIPSGTRLLSLTQEGRLVTVNFSGEFAQNMEGTPDDTEATIAMVVNTLITLPGIDRVSILVDGERPQTINGLRIREIYEFITEYYPDK